MTVSAASIDNLFYAIPTDQTQLDGLANKALSRGIDLYMKQNYGDAVKEFRRAAGLSPFSDNSAKAYDFMARAYLLDGNTDAAIKTYKEAIRVYPTRDALRVSLGDIYYKQGLISEAKVEYTAAVKLNPNSPDSRYALGQVYLNSEKYSEAEVEFKKVVSLSPGSTIGYYGLGQTYRKTGDYKDAITQLEKAAALDRTFDNGFIELGYTYTDMGDLDNANSMADTLTANGSSSSASAVTDYIYQITTPKFFTVYSTNGFNDSLGPGTVSRLNSTLAASQAEKSFTTRFVFTKEMDAASVQNPFNWWISRASGTNAGGAYNWGLTIPATETRIGAIPASVIYDPEAFSADVTFKVVQNAAGDATIDPSHIMFKFSGIDAYGKAMDLTADEYSGISEIV
jgi:predicted Zn-dependent protease